MKHIKHILKDESGSVLVTAVIFLAVAVTIVGSFLSLASTEARTTEMARRSLSALYISEAGVNQTDYYLRNLGYPPEGIEPVVVFQDEPIGDGSFTVTLDPDDSNPGNYMKRYEVLSIGRYGTSNIGRQITATFRIASFAKYAYFTDNEYHPTFGTIWFHTDDLLEGPVHSNSRFNMYGYPTFEGLVTSTASDIRYYNGGPPYDDPNFNGGLNLGVSRIDLPDNLDALKSASLNGGIYMNGDTQIWMNSDGTMTYRVSYGSYVTVPLSSINGAVYVNGKTKLMGGTLDGRLTIGSKYNVEIYDSIVYKDDPTVGSSDDVFGLVSERNIVLQDSAPHDVEINATMMALDDSFYVENYDQTWNLNGELRVLGGLIQNYRGPVGTFNSSTGTQRSGYTKDYHYDKRLADTPPPFFPTTGQFERTWWKEEGVDLSTLPDV
jgi:hypothetical protein